MGTADSGFDENVFLQYVSILGSMQGESNHVKRPQP